MEAIILYLIENWDYVGLTVLAIALGKPIAWMLAPKQWRENTSPWPWHWRK